MGHKSKQLKQNCRVSDKRTEKELNSVENDLRTFPALETGGGVVWNIRDAGCGVWSVENEECWKTSMFLCVKNIRQKVKQNYFCKLPLISVVNSKEVVCSYTHLHLICIFFTPRFPHASFATVCTLHIL